MMDRIAITTCEIDEDLDTALRIGTEWEIRNYELRSVWEKRVPRFEEEETEKLLALVQQYGVQVVGLSPSVFREEYSEQEAAASMEILDRSFELARALGCRNIVVFSFRRKENEAPDFILDDAVQVLREAAGKAQQNGMELVHEPMANLYGDTSTNLLRLVQAVGHPYFNINWDPANMCKTGDEAIFPEGYDFIKAYIKHVHLKNWTVEGKWATLNRGALDWGEILAALKRDAYDGYLTIETHHPPLVEQSERNHEWLKEAMASS